MTDTKKSLDAQPYTYRFGDTFDEYIQVLIDEFELTRQEHGKCLKFEINAENLSLRDPKARSMLSEHIRKNEKGGPDQMAVQMKQFEKDENILSYRFENHDNPFRYANGGVLPIIRMKGKDYFCLFFRAIFPVGWNIANGASNDIDDIRNPVNIIHREFSEEFIIADHENKLLYMYDVHNQKTMSGTQEQAIKLWSKDLKDYDLASYSRRTIPLKWIEGGDKLELKYGNDTYSHEGFFLNITPEDNAIELDKIALINLKGRFSFYDGEIAYTKKKNGLYASFVIDRPIGFFPVEELMNNLDKHRFEPEFYYKSGKRYKGKAVHGQLIKEYTTRHENKKFRGDNEKEIYEKAKKRRRDKDLCPISRAVITNYKRWIEAEKLSIENLRQAMEKDETVKSPLQKKDRKKFDIFISFRSKDQNLAELLYAFLTKAKYKVFCSSKSIQLLGSSAYAQAIDSALEDSVCMVLVSSDLENFDSGWVEYEWRTFQMLLFSGDKKGELFTLTQNIFPGDLPTGLRYRENIQILDNAYQLSFENLLAYIKKIIPKNESK